MTALAMMHVAKRDLGLDDDTYRAVLLRVTGKRSSKDMSESEQRAVLDEFRRQGFKPALRQAQGEGRGKTKPLSGPYAKKAQALWIALWNLGAVEDKRDSALLAFVCRQTGIERTEWVLDAKHGRAVIEALKGWCAREGVDWSDGGRHGFQIALAQWSQLQLIDRSATRGFWVEIASILKRSVVVDKPTDAEWITVMNALGKRIRARKAGSS
ncbi:gp16 family protein [Jiella pacifica]|uniref:DUF1018 domain-containing protein n=1 Tax=Jiella pacifica TaxID=2696469 RepID=A0A6N9SZ08_9HYPH|nr:regulatory protein GemA [Jiella pacifica]NDW04051.1 DUF1018 domain-containing protein [Jiella pacifica]